MEFHDKLKLFFKAKGESQVAAAEKMGYSKSSMSQYLNGRNPNMEFLLKLYQAYPDVDFNHLFKKEEKGISSVVETEMTYPNSLAVIEDIEHKLSILKANFISKKK
jgi:transcriptional regulator with XRE-family HTH domain